jgi:hypothetical protein
VHIDRGHDVIKGTYVIDPSLFVPASFLAPHPESSGPRPNLRVRTENGGIDIDVYVVLGTRPGMGARAGLKAPERVLIQAESTNGSISLRPVRPTPLLSPRRSLDASTHFQRNHTSVPLTLTATSENGGVQVFLSRNFRGVVTQVSKNGTLKTSDAMNAHVSHFSEAHGRRTLFVGDMDPALGGWDASGDHWLGDTVIVESVNGPVKLGWIDETLKAVALREEGPPSRRVSTLF